ncbi:hypothetical protein Pisl_0065 [Pyrobaculum islandicum DSM 4184]|uniref:Uncharacterized protein n=1 Tax=Pyrobaculum islandicum (strain DSM 4184 / JCM 9189 / GEO3) TaxID=384616 RepID=A1RQL7_PYRIL|nr:hypothetical protein Pisl_0065 [Pyrobaculum islandicum DSM 4184]
MGQLYLLAGLPAHVKPPGDLVDAAKGLDKFYIPSRYPNAHPERTPMDYFTRGMRRAPSRGL